MEYWIIGITALLASLLTLISGFGLGTILTPVFMLFFPIEKAIAMTGIVHLFNNLFKVGLLGKFANLRMVLKFGLPAMIGAFAGAQLLLYLSGSSPWFTYELSGKQLAVMPVNFVAALTMIFFALMEIVPRMKKIQFSQKLLIPGGLLSGFFGGLSGHQGALRSAFLIRYGLSKESFIATGVVIACLIDFIRIPVYFERFSSESLEQNWKLMLVATLAAFSGAFIGRKLMTKITLKAVQLTVSLMIIALAVLLGMGII